MKFVRPPQLSEAEQMELAIKAAAARQREQRRKWITIAGALLNLAALPTVAVLETLFHRTAWWDQARLFAFLGIPFVIGTLVAFAGMTMTDHRRDVVEWGARMPLTCAAYGAMPLRIR